MSEAELVTVVENQNTTVLNIIQQAAKNPDVDIDKMERLLQMQERIMDKQSEQSFNIAMKVVQEQIPSVLKNKTNTQTNSKYADLEAINNAINPVITKNGFSISFGTDQSPLEKHYRITGIVSHVDGHSRTYQVDIPQDDAGIKGTKNKSNTHAFGSSMSYGRRYLNLLIWNISTSDDDGNLAGAGELITESQVKELQTLIDETETDIQQFCKFQKIKSLTNMPLNQFGKAIKLFEAKKAKIK